MKNGGRGRWCRVEGPAFEEGKRGTYHGQYAISSSIIRIILVSD